MTAYLRAANRWVGRMPLAGKFIVRDLVVASIAGSGSSYAGLVFVVIIMTAGHASQAWLGLSLEGWAIIPGSLYAAVNAAVIGHHGRILCRVTRLRRRGRNGRCGVIAHPGPIDYAIAFTFTLGGQALMIGLGLLA